MRAQVYPDGDDGAAVEGELEVLEYICTHHATLAGFWPDVTDSEHYAAHLVKVRKVADFCRTSLAPRVASATGGTNEGLLAIALDTLRDSYVGRDGYMVGDQFGVADLLVVTTIRPWTLMEGAVPHEIRELEHFAQHTMCVAPPPALSAAHPLTRAGVLFVCGSACSKGWTELMEPWDRAAIRDAEDSQDMDRVPPGHSSAWATHITKSRPVQPRDVLRLAANIGIVSAAAVRCRLLPPPLTRGRRRAQDVDAEPTLLWLVRHALETPLPPHWRVVGHRPGSGTADGKKKAVPGTLQRSMSHHPTSRGSDGIGGLDSAPATGGRRMRATQSFHPGGKQVERKEEEKGVRFVNQLTGESTFVHPGAKFLLSDVAEARSFAESIGVSLGVAARRHGAWMQFRGIDGDDHSSVAVGPKAESRRASADSAGAGAGVASRRSSAGSGAAAGGAGGDGEKEEDERTLKMTMGSLGVEAGIPSLSRPATQGAGRPGTSATAMSTRERIEAAQKAAEPVEEDPDAGYFWHDFLTGEEGHTLPDGARELPRPASASEAPATLVEQAPGDAMDATAQSIALTSTLNRSRARRKKGAASAANLSTMCFSSWWYEGNGLPFHNMETRGASDSSMTKHVIDIEFDVDTGAVRVAMRGDDKTYSLSHVNGKDGPLECWDLHVGARIDVLGRATTLMQATAATQAWIDHHALRLRRLIARMEAELVKYDRATAATLMRKRQQPERKGGRNNLRGMLDLLDLLRRNLAKYRPKLAMSIVQSIADPHADGKTKRGRK